jgi:stage III sporulation protein AG
VNQPFIAVRCGDFHLIVDALENQVGDNALQRAFLWFYEVDVLRADDNVYRQQLEQQLSDLIAQVEGAGKTTVMITLESGEETIYALDTLSGQTQEQQTHVLLDDGTALAQTICTPRVCGVAVVCEGGGDVRVAARITELVGALLDVPSNRICVEQRRE